MQKKVNYFIFISSLIFIGTNNVLAYGGQCVTCGSDSLAIPEALPKFVATMITLVQILVPIALILFTMIRYLKAVTLGEDKGFSEANRAFIRNIVAAVAVFLVIAIVKFAFGVVEKANEESGSTSCVSCFITGNCESESCPERGQLNESSKNDSSKTVNNGEGCYYCPKSGKYKWLTEQKSNCQFISSIKSKSDCNNPDVSNYKSQKTCESAGYKWQKLSSNSGYCYK